MHLYHSLTVNRQKTIYLGHVKCDLVGGCVYLGHVKRDLVDGCVYLGRVKCDLVCVGVCVCWGVGPN